MSFFYISFVLNSAKQLWLRWCENWLLMNQVRSFQQKIRTRLDYDYFFIYTQICNLLKYLKCMFCETNGRVRDSETCHRYCRMVKDSDGFGQPYIVTRQVWPSVALHRRSHCSQIKSDIAASYSQNLSSSLSFSRKSIWKLVGGQSKRSIKRFNLKMKIEISQKVAYYKCIPREQRKRLTPILAQPRLFKDWFLFFNLNTFMKRFIFFLMFVMNAKWHI